jgi:hypothetical protein
MANDNSMKTKQLRVPVELPAKRRGVSPDSPNVEGYL